MHWISWKALCEPKAHNRMGFKYLEDFNRVLLAKQGWHILSNPNSLLARTLKAKYFPYSSFLQAGHNPSWGWRSIL